MIEKAFLTIRYSNKKKLIAEIQINDRCPMAIQEYFLVDADMDKKKCEVERIDGKPVKIIVEGKALKSKQRDKPSNNIDTKKSRTHTAPATAPYNFVPLNKEIITQDRPGSFNIYHGNTGYIDLEIEARTPIYIGGFREENGKSSDYDFYKQAGKYCIPGSSIRGMIRAMVEMTSWSKFSIFNDDYLYYRSFADNDTSIRDEYKKHMISAGSKGNAEYRMSSGLLLKEGLHYSIIPSIKTFKRIKKSDVKDNKKKADKYRLNGLYACEYKESHCYLVVSGSMPGKKHDWLVYLDPNDPKARENTIHIMDIDIESYQNDNNRNSVNLIEEIKKNGDIVPCFYVEWQDEDSNKRISFGHTPLFRLSYTKSIADHITSEKDRFDIAESIFGNENDFMTRLFFECAFLRNNDYDKVYTKEKTPQTLSGPKPTSFQLYLEQKTGARLMHYNDVVNIRGNKLYWHKITSESTWKDDFKLNMDIKMKPIKEGAKFQGRIRFENLSAIELGALLFAVDLPKDLAHKIGMAKPLGLGSVRINSKLFLSNRENRYKNLFAEWDGIMDKSEEIKQFKQIFEEYIVCNIDEPVNNLWETNRLKELEKMLNFEHKPKAEKIKYMTFGTEGFIERRILPRPTDV